MAELNDDARAALSLLPAAKEIAAFVRSKLPPDAHWGVMLILPGQPEGRVIALTSDRDAVAPAVAHWVMDVLGRTDREEAHRG